VRPLQASLRVSVAGPGAFTSFDAPRVFVDGIDRTASAGVQIVEQTELDFDQDGDVDQTNVSLEVQLGALELESGQLVEVDVSAETAGGVKRCRTASRVAPHVDVRISDVVTFTDQPTQLYLEWRELELATSVLVVRVAGYDVTPWVGITGPQVLDEATTNGFVTFRAEAYELDFSALAGLGLEGLPLSIEAWGAGLDGGVTSAAASSSIAAATGLDPCHEAALAAFCTALHLSKDAAGSVSSGADAKAQKKAVDDLQAALALCDKPFPKDTQTFTCNGLTVKIKIGGASQSVKTSDRADAVIAIGGDGTGSGNGGNGDATNTQPGGFALGAGGDGGSGASSAGNGGNGSGTATNGAGGTPPGSASGIGGSGGTPTPGYRAGGNGGSGNATTQPPRMNQPSPGVPGSPGHAPSGSNPGSPGTHGGGGWAGISGGTSSNGNFGSGSN
jgi:hypothetical protein